MCQASQMSEDILSEDIELTENVRQGGTVNRKETKDRNWCTCVSVTHTAPVVFMLPNDGDLD